jgi:hypothetical protein
MKTMFNSNNRGKSILYILFAIALLSFAALLLNQMLFQVYISSEAFTLIFAFLIMCIASLGGFIIQIRNGPPW